MRRLCTRKRVDLEYRVGQSASIWIALVALCFIACAGCPHSEPNPRVISEVEQPYPDSWRNQFDFNGDGLNDEVEVEYTGGAHCCYRISVGVTGDGARLELPLLLDGGYTMGLDLSKPDEFAIADRDGDGRPELHMHVYVYNGVEEPIPETIVEAYGLRSNRVVVEYENNEWTVRDRR